ncbi:MAG: proton-conducting transporter transmembrane domain-containing protein, partial [Planctomycetota bacterium]
MTLAASIICLAALAAIAPAVVRLAGARAGGLVAVVPGAWFAWFAAQAPGIVGGTPILTPGHAWVPGLDLHLAWRLDGLSLLMALLVTGVGSLICLFAGGTMGAHPRFGGFLRGLLAFMAAMLGLVIADDLILLFAFWELTSITSFLLIGFHRERAAARAAALRALLVTGAGGLALLAGLVLLGIAAETFRVSELLTRGDLVREHAWYPAILTLVCLGCFTKSAQVPFHFWLPGAMEAPAPVSAYLHSSTMVKAGVFLLALLTPVLGGTPAWEWTLKVVGATTMLVGALGALRATKLKKILACTTVSALGTMVMLLGLGVPGDAAAMTFLLAHALYKGSLFIVAGVLEARTGEKDAERLGGLARRMPVTFTAAVLAGLSLAGIPPLFGFAGKYLMKDALTASPWTMPLLVAVTVTGVAMTAAALMIALRPFRGPATDATATAREGGPSLVLGPAILAVLSLIAGVAPGLFADPIVRAATDAVTGRPGDAELSSLHLFSLSAIAGPTGIALAGGIGLFAVRERYRRATDRLRLPEA